MAGDIWILDVSSMSWKEVSIYILGTSAAHRIVPVDVMRRKGLWGLVVAQLS